MSAETLESHARQLLEPQDGDWDSYDFYVKLVGPGAPMRLTTNAGRRLFADVLTALILITPTACCSDPRVTLPVIDGQKN